MSTKIHFILNFYRFTENVLNFYKNHDINDYIIKSKLGNWQINCHFIRQNKTKIATFWRNITNKINYLGNDLFKFKRNIIIL